MRTGAVDRVQQTRPYLSLALSIVVVRVLFRLRWRLIAVVTWCLFKRSGLLGRAVAIAARPEFAAGLLEQRSGTACRGGHEAEHLLRDPVVLSCRHALLLALLLVELLGGVVLLVLRLLLIWLLLLRLLTLLGLLWRILLRCLIVRIRLARPLGVSGIALVVGYLAAVSRLLRLLWLLRTLLTRNLLHSR